MKEYSRLYKNFYVFFIGRNIAILWQRRIFTAYIASALNFIRCSKSWNKFRQLVFFMNKFTIPYTLLHQSLDRKRESENQEANFTIAPSLPAVKLVFLCYYFLIKHFH